MDLSLDDLLSGLQAAQEKKATAKLSERNVIELVNKLKQLGILGDELVHTTNGKEYITRAQVKVEVQKAVAEAGGRIPLVDLPAVVGVDLVLCERAAEELIQGQQAGHRGRGGSGSGGIFQAQGELFTPLYFDGLAAEVDEGLQEVGLVVLGEVARKFGLAADLLTAQLEMRVGGAVRGRLEGGVIYTPAYLARVKAQLRGALRGALAPVTLSSLTKALRLEGLAPVQALLPSLIEELMREGAVEGKVTGGATSWVPGVFVSAQQDAVKRFFQQNGYISYDTVSKYGIPSPRSFLQQHFPQGIPLETSFVAPAVVDQVEVSMEEAVQAGAWCDVQSVLPSALSPSDTAALLQRCTAPSAAGGGASAPPPTTKAARQLLTLAQTCLVTPAFVEGLRGPLLEEARKGAAEAHQRQRTAGQQAQQAQQGADQTKGGTGAGGRQRAAGGAAAGSDDEDDWDMGRGRGAKKGKGKKGKGGPSGKATGKAGKASKQPTQQDDAAASSALSVDSLAERLLVLHPDLEGAGAEGELAAELAAELRPAVVAEYERALHAIFTAGAEERRKRREAAGESLDEAHLRLQLFSHGAELFSSDEPTHTALQKHLLRTAAADCMDCLLRYLAADLAAEGGGRVPGEARQEEGQAGGSLAGLTPAQRSAIVKELGPDVKPAASTALEKLGGSSLETFGMEFAAAAEAAGLWLRKLDKKAERSRVQRQQREWEEQLGGEGEGGAPTPGAFLLILVPLLLARHFSRVVSLPGRTLAAAVEKLRKCLPDEGHDVLVQLQAGVVQQLRGQGGGDGEGVTRDDAKLQELVQAARRLLVLGEAQGQQAEG